MADRLRTELKRRFAGARLGRAGDLITIEAEVEGAWYRARADGGSSDRGARVAVELPSTDGFVLSIKWSDRWAGGDTQRTLALERAASFDDSAIVETNDLALAAGWIDGRVRDALLAARFVSVAGVGNTARMWRDRGWAFELAGDEVSGRRLPGEAAPERVVSVLEAALTLASRPARWARAFQPAARMLGGELAPRVEIGGKPVLRTRRDRTDVRLYLVRRLGPADGGRLRTLVSAHRHASTGDGLTLVRDDLARAAVPPPGTLGATVLPLDPHALQLLELCSPSATTLRDHDVEIIFDGAVTDPARLDAAVELAAWWSTEARASTGPYR